MVLPPDDHGEPDPSPQVGPARLDSHGYRGRFAPSPTGPLHAGSLVAALASWLDARAQGGQWLVRIEDVDTPRCQPGMDVAILAQLAACGLLPDAPPLVQSQRDGIYQAALDHLVSAELAYPCACSRKDIENAWARMGRPLGRHRELVYPGTCRHGLNGRPARAWRLNVERAAGGEAVVDWHDRRLGPQRQDVAAEVGDFVLRRADGLWAYQLAVVVDDAAQGITDVVRGQDLADNTPRQVLLQRALGLPTPRYLHTPLVLGDNGEKLSKQNGARPFDSGTQAGTQAGTQTGAKAGALAALASAARHLGLPAPAHAAPGTGEDPAEVALSSWVAAWRALYNPARE